MDEEGSRIVDSDVDSSITGAVDSSLFDTLSPCDALDDDPVDFDGIAIPVPPEQLYEFSLAVDQQAECDLEDPAVCSL